jgi:hypothetical protein
MSLSGVERVLQFCAAKHTGEAVDAVPDSAAKKALLIQVGKACLLTPDTSCLVLVSPVCAKQWL